MGSKLQIWSGDIAPEDN